MESLLLEQNENVGLFCFQHYLEGSLLKLFWART